MHEIEFPALTAGVVQNQTQKGYKRIPFVTQFIRPMRGRAMSHLAAASDNNLYVMKMQPNPQGSNVLANEFIGSQLLNALSLPCPRLRVIEVCDFMLINIKDKARLANRMTPVSGRHAGSLFLDRQGHGLYDFIPTSFDVFIRNTGDLLPMLIFDVWSLHTDRRQKVFRQHKRNGSIAMFFIDNGDLFGGPEWQWNRTDIDDRCKPHRISDRLFTKMQPLESDIECQISRFRKVIPPILKEILTQVPKEWYRGDILALQENFLRRLDSLEQLVWDALWKE